MKQNAIINHGLALVFQFQNCPKRERQDESLYFRSSLLTKVISNDVWDYTINP